MITPQFPSRFESGRRSGADSSGSRGAVRVARVDDNSSHLMPRLIEVNARNENWSSLDTIGCEQASSTGGNFANDESQIEARFFEPAGNGGKFETPGQLRCINTRLHAAGDDVTASFSIGNATRSGITVAITAPSRQRLAFGHAEQSRAIFSGSACRDEVSKPWRAKNSGACVTANTR